MRIKKYFLVLFVALFLCPAGSEAAIPWTYDKTPATIFLKAPDGTNVQAAGDPNGIAKMSITDSAGTLIHIDPNTGDLWFKLVAGGAIDIGAKTDTAVYDPNSASSIIGRLGGILKQLQGTGSGSAPVAINQGTPGTTNGVYVNTLASGGSVDIGALSDASSIDPNSTTASLIALLKGILKQFQGTGTGEVPASIADGSDITQGATTDLPIIDPNVAASVNARLAGVQSLLQGVGSLDITDDASRELGKISADDGDIDAIGAKADASSADPNSTSSMISLIKGLLKQLQGTGSGGAPVSIADGADVTQGAKADLPIIDPNVAASINSRLAGIESLLLGNGSLPVTFGGVTPWTDPNDALYVRLTLNEVDISDDASRELGKVSADDGDLATVGAKDDAASTDPNSDISLISIGKGLLKLNGGLVTSTLHRSAISAVDKIVGLAALGTADMGEGTGSLPDSTTYYCRVDAANRFGIAPQTLAIPTQATGAGADTFAIQLTVAQVTGADGYHVFLSTDAAPKWVGYITETQRADGCSITAVGTVGAGTVAGKVDVQVAGTGIQTSDASFSYNTAYTIGSITPIDCTGYKEAYLTIKAALTGNFTTAPVLKFIPAQYNTVSTSDWAFDAAQSMTLLTSGCPMEQHFTIPLKGTQFAVLFDTLTGITGTVWVSLR